MLLVLSLMAQPIARRPTDVLSAVYPNSVHVMCTAHIVNLASEVFPHRTDFKHTSDLIAMIKSSFFKKPGKKSRLLKFLADFIASSDVKLPPVLVSSRWNSWFQAASYVSCYQSSSIRRFLQGGEVTRNGS